MKAPELTKPRLIARLSWYYPMELFNAVLFSAITAYVLIEFALLHTFSLLYGLAFMSFILYQGGYYWMIKLNSLKHDIAVPGRHVKMFRKLKRVNEYAIAVSIVLLALHIISGELSKGMLYWSLLTNGFAILEYINYYHKQLMIDNSHDVHYVIRHRRLKTASLKKDLTSYTLSNQG